MDIHPSIPPNAQADASCGKICRKRNARPLAVSSATPAVHMYMYMYIHNTGHACTPHSNSRICVSGTYEYQGSPEVPHGRGTSYVVVNLHFALLQYVHNYKQYNNCANALTKGPAPDVCTLCTYAGTCQRTWMSMTQGN